MVLSTFLFATMHVFIRRISSDMPPVQIAFFRNFFGLLVFIPIIYRNGFGFLQTKRLPLHCVRAVVNAGAMFAFFTALSLAPIARITAISFAAPLFAAVLSVLVLGEKFRMRRWAAVIIGFLGTLVILRPGIIPLDLGSMLVVFAAAMWGITMIIIKVLSRTESSLTITGYVTLLLTIVSIGPALYVWQSPSMETLAWLLLIAVLGTIGQISMAEALKSAETTVVMPFDFLKLVWVAMLGYLMFAEIPDLYTWLGAGIVFASSFYLAYRESRMPIKADF
jgi:drug/metabolite transporter (DMT)-like permease